MEKLTVKTVFIVSLIVLIGGILIGKYALPSKVITKTEIQIVEKEVVKYKEVEDKKEKKNQEVTETETRLPDGTVKKEKKTVDKGEIVTNTQKESEKTKETTSITKIETVTINKKWDISLLVTPSHKDDNVLGSSLSYGLHVQKLQVFGPVNVGGFIISNKVYGLTIGGSF